MRRWPPICMPGSMTAPRAAALARPPARSHRPRDRLCPRSCRAPDNEAEARRATSLLYHVASAVALAWEGGRIVAMRAGQSRCRCCAWRSITGARRRSFRLTENATQRARSGDLLGDRAAGMAEVGELLLAA